MLQHVGLLECLMTFGYGSQSRWALASQVHLTGALTKYNFNLTATGWLVTGRTTKENRSTTAPNSLQEETTCRSSKLSAPVQALRSIIFQEVLDSGAQVVALSQARNLLHQRHQV